MKRVLAMMLFFMIALGSYAGDKVRGELRTEINGFQWYCYKNKEAYSIDGKCLTKYSEDVNSINFVVADKYDEGIFVFMSKKWVEIFKPNGERIYIEERNTSRIDGIKRMLTYSISRIPIVFSNPDRKEYFTRIKHQYCKNYYYLITHLGKIMTVWGEYTTLDNFLLINNKTNNPDVLVKTGIHIYTIGGEEIGIVDLIEKIGNTNIYKVKDDVYSSYRYITSNGNEVFKGQYDEINACGDKYLKVKSKGFFGILNLDGKEIIPTSRGYTSIGDYNSSKGTFAFTKKGFSGVCDAQGREISTTRLAPTSDDIKTNGGYASVVEMKNGSTKYYKVSKNGRYGLTDNEGRAVIPCEMEALESAGTDYLRYKLNGFWGLMNYQGKVLIDTDRGYTSIGDFKSFNKRFAYTMNGYKGECDATGRQISKIKVDTPKPNTSVASSSGSSSSSSSSSNNSRNKTTTVVVEHQHTPQPFQQWQACWACGGSGTMGCDNCGGSGTKYIGDRLHRCSRCNGQGIIPCNVCYGNKGQYITVYR